MVRITVALPDLQNLPRVPVPAGKLCQHCGEAIEAKDSASQLFSSGRGRFARRRSSSMTKRQAADRKVQKHENRPEGRLCSVRVVVRRVLLSRSRNPQGAVLIAAQLSPHRVPFRLVLPVYSRFQSAVVR
jgi:hypothetical protein